MKKKKLVGCECVTDSIFRLGPLYSVFLEFWARYSCDLAVSYLYLRYATLKNNANKLLLLLNILFSLQDIKSNLSFQKIYLKLKSDITYLILKNNKI